MATGRAWLAPTGVYVGGGATLPSDRRRGTPAVVTYGGSMSSPILLGLGFEKVGEVTHMVDRLPD